MRSFTDIFIKHPVLAVVVNLVIILVGWRSLMSLPVQQYPQIESSSVIVTTVYTGASAETVKGFLTTPIERAVSAISSRVRCFLRSRRPGWRTSEVMGFRGEERLRCPRAYVASLSFGTSAAEVDP